MRKLATGRHPRCEELGPDVRIASLWQRRGKARSTEAALPSRGLFILVLGCRLVLSYLAAFRVVSMLEVVQTLSDSNLFLLAFSALIFDVPRYTLSLVSLAVFGSMGKGSARDQSLPASSR